MSEFASSDFPCVSVSAPGKVLIAGGYLVLKFPYIGLTLSTNARFYTTITTLSKDTLQSINSEEEISIVVESPQLHETYHYYYNLSTQKISQLGDTSNVFIEKCLLINLIYIQENSKSQLLSLARKFKNKTLQEEGKPLLSSSLATLPRFTPCPLDSAGHADIAKTGLGSSAALVTSLTAALLQYFSIIHLNDKDTNISMNMSSYKNLQNDTRKLHNLSQLSHAIAQGKVGSGFDVASAVYGSILYQRFDPLKLEPYMRDDYLANYSQIEFLLDDEDLTSTPSLQSSLHAPLSSSSSGHSGSPAAGDSPSCEYSSLLRSYPSSLSTTPTTSTKTQPESPLTAPRLTLRGVVESSAIWSQMKMYAFSLPFGFELVMGDICGGSSSTSMAKSVLDWYANNKEVAVPIWSELSKTNKAISKAFQTISFMYMLDPESYIKQLHDASVLPANQWTTYFSSSSTTVTPFTTTAPSATPPPPPPPHTAGSRGGSGDFDLDDRPSVLNFSADAANTKNELVSMLSSLRQLFVQARQSLKTIGELAGVDIEPPSQTTLADATQNIPGVLCAGVPGAGGRDAIFALIITSAARGAVEEVWSQWSTRSDVGEAEEKGQGGVVSPLLVREDSSVDGSRGGVRLERELLWD